MKIKKIVSGMACMVTLAACNLDYHEYANYGKDYIDESYENVIGMTLVKHIKVECWHPLVMKLNMPIQTMIYVIL